jgi:hypothetical protein
LNTQAVLAISNGQHKTNNLPALITGVVVILLIVAVSAWSKRRQ